MRRILQPISFLNIFHDLLCSYSSVAYQTGLVDPYPVFWRDVVENNTNDETSKPEYSLNRQGFSDWLIDNWVQ